MKSIEKEREKLLTRSDSLSVNHLPEVGLNNDGSLSRQSSSSNMALDSFVNIKIRLQAQKKLEKYRVRKVNNKVRVFLYENYHHGYELFSLESIP